MKVAKEARLRKLAKNFSATVNAASARIGQAQQAIIEEAATKKAVEERALKRRIGLARGSLRRLIAFGADPALQQIVETMSRMPSRTDVEFFTLRWTWIGEQWNSTLCVSFEADGVRLQTLDVCHAEEVKTFVVSYTGEEVTHQESLGNRAGSTTTLSVDDFLKAIATLERVDFEDLTAQPSRNVYPEEDVLFEVLVSWARKAAFEEAVTDCFRHLEQELKRVKLRAA